MPKQVDHDQRRREIAAAVGRLAQTRGLQSVSFREVATESQMSVALVQHYFGTKQNLLVDSLNIQSEAVGQRIAARLDSVGVDGEPLERLRAIATAFLPTDVESRAAMLLYHGFAAAALTDESLRGADAFRNEAVLRGAISALFVEASRAGELVDGVDPDTEARAIVAMVLGLSLTVLLDGSDAAAAIAVLDAHLNRLRRQ